MTTEARESTFLECSKRAQVNMEAVASDWRQQYCGSTVSGSTAASLLKLSSSQGLYSKCWLLTEIWRTVMVLLSASRKISCSCLVSTLYRFFYLSCLKISLGSSPNFNSLEGQGARHENSLARNCRAISAIFSMFDLRRYGRAPTVCFS